MNRRGFLQSCIALATAPAIVRAESIMRIWTPPRGSVEFLWPSLEFDPGGKSFTASAIIRTGKLSRWERQIIQITPESPYTTPAIKIDKDGNLGVESGGVKALKIVVPYGCSLDSFPRAKLEFGGSNDSRLVLGGDSMNCQDSTISIIQGHR